MLIFALCLLLLNHGHRTVEAPVKTPHSILDSSFIGDGSKLDLHVSRPGEYGETVLTCEALRPKASLAGVLNGVAPMSDLPLRTRGVPATDRPGVAAGPAKKKLPLSGTLSGETNNLDSHLEAPASKETVHCLVCKFQGYEPSYKYLRGRFLCTRFIGSSVISMLTLVHDDNALCVTAKKGETTYLQRCDLWHQLVGFPQGEGWHLARGWEWQPHSAWG